MGVTGTLYLNDRFFYAMAVAVALFLVSYTVAVLFPVAIAFVCLVALLLLVEIVTLYRRRNIAASRAAASIFSLHDENKIHIKVSNTGGIALRLRIIDELPYQFNKRDLSFALKLAPRETQSLSYSLVPVIRGAYHFGDIRIFLTTLIGMASRRETTAAETTVAVYPSIAQMAREELAAMRHPAFSTGGNRTRRRGQSYEFEQVKAYIPGDDTRHINWKASSTMRELMVNHYEDERSQQVYSVIDKSRVMKTPFGGLPLFDHTVNASLAFSNIVLKKQDKAGLIVFSKQAGTLLKADRGARQLERIMYALYREQYDYSEADYENLYITIRKQIPNRSLVFLYTNFESMQALERRLPLLKLINKYHLLVIVFFEDEELQEYARSEARRVLDIYQLVTARRFLLERSQVALELKRHGILSMRCKPESLSAAAINKYLELKSAGRI